MFTTIFQNESLICCGFCCCSKSDHTSSLQKTCALLISDGILLMILFSSIETAMSLIWNLWRGEIPSDLLQITPCICLMYYGLLPIHALQLHLLNDFLIKKRNYRWVWTARAAPGWTSCSYRTVPTPMSAAEATTLLAWDLKSLHGVQVWSDSGMSQTVGLGTLWVGYWICVTSLAFQLPVRDLCCAFTDPG